MSNLPAKKETFFVDLPENAPALGFDPEGELVSWDMLDSLAPNYFSEDTLEDIRQSLGGWPVYTLSHLQVQTVVDPLEDKDKWDLTPKLVMYFNETSIGLVLNQTRCKQMSSITGTRNIKQWVELAPPVSLEWGLWNKKAQIGIAPAGEPVHGRQAKNGRASGKQVVADVNEELFGK